jgi:copper(I)-binding protein
VSAYDPGMRTLVLAASALLLAAPAAARDVTKGDLTLVQPQMRASLGRAPTTGGYVTIRNAGARPDRLLSASCACAERVELHTHQMSGGVGRMTRVPAIAVPAKGETVLAPGGAHLMFIGLKGRLADGQEQPVTLVFERAGKVTARFPVRARVEAPAAAEHHGH